MAVFVFDADAAVKIKNNKVAGFEQESIAAVGEEVPSMDEQEMIATLENDIRILDEEIAKCQKQKKGWIAATVIGGAGVVSTGVAAAVQGVKIKDQKDTLSDQTKTLKDLQKQKTDLDTKLKK